VPSNSVMSWSTSATEPARRAVGCRLRAACPSNRISPESLDAYSPATSLATVDLPQPERPTMRDALARGRHSTRKAHRSSGWVGRVVAEAHAAQLEVARQLGTGFPSCKSSGWTLQRHMPLGQRVALVVAARPRRAAGRRAGAAPRSIRPASADRRIATKLRRPGPGRPPACRWSGGRRPPGSPPTAQDHAPRLASNSTAGTCREVPEPQVSPPAGARRRTAPGQPPKLGQEATDSAAGGAQGLDHRQPAGRRCPAACPARSTAPGCSPA
jgi:hypothetical protein